jgi:hypothetical protein
MTTADIQRLTSKGRFVIKINDKDMGISYRTRFTREGANEEVRYATRQCNQTATIVGCPK